MPDFAVSVIVALLITLVIYFFGAFVSLSWNPVEWTAALRFLAALALVAGIYRLIVIANA